ncbi:NusG domain II-containing protein [Selenomonas sp. TAMA-11512]|uniref:NusG domain II-containing protein n=1 Tax=Selenomonas sp. TAMA-11512 TaxID=3095337 RepID=UPI00308777AF|nr:NusG domain II-containing protein [Selenomonas sp. TAMA-11512]
MKHKGKDIIVKVIFVVLGLAGLYGLLAAVYANFTQPDRDAAVEIRQDGKVLYVLTEQDLHAERTFTVKYQGHYNKIETGGGEVRVIEADCPDQICVRTGALHRHHGPIICLPHRLEIRYREADEVDAVAH